MAGRGGRPVGADRARAGERALAWRGRGAGPPGGAGGGDRGRARLPCLSARDREDDRLCELRDLRSLRTGPRQPLQSDLAARGAGDLAVRRLSPGPGGWCDARRRLLPRRAAGPRGPGLRAGMVASSWRTGRSGGARGRACPVCVRALRGHSLPGGEVDRDRGTARDAALCPRPVQRGAGDRDRRAAGRRRTASRWGGGGVGALGAVGAARPGPRLPGRGGGIEPRRARQRARRPG